jgi:hypothetical protein
MKWVKRGLIFNPADYEWDLNFVGYAQSPQVLVFDSLVRVYFATRVRDDEGKFLSHIRYVDFTRDFTKVLSISRHCIVPLGRVGCFDEHGIFPINPLWVGDKVYAYTNGWSRRRSVSVETGIGFLVSHDQGETFERLGDGPVLSSTNHEPVLVGDPFVVQNNGEFHMWYIYGERWEKSVNGGVPERIYKIADAVSEDGIKWTKKNRRLIVDRLGVDECQALPTVAQWDGIYHMFFCYRRAFDFRQNVNNGYRIGYACSTDLEHWKRDDVFGGITPSTEGWDSDMMCYPHLFQIDGKVHLLYNGNQFGREGFGLATLD